MSPEKNNTVNESSEPSEGTTVSNCTFTSIAFSTDSVDALMALTAAIQLNAEAAEKNALAISQNADALTEVAKCFSSVQLESQLKIVGDKVSVSDSSMVGDVGNAAVVVE